MEEEIDLFAELESKPLPGTDAVRRVMNLYYIIDTSGSMKGDRIESINQVMPEIVQLVAGISNSNNDTAEIKVNTLCFSTGTSWMYSAPVPANDFKWINCQAGGVTDLGAACEELEKHLHKASDLGSSQRHYAPALILLTDGAPTDDFDHGYAKLAKNAWFKSAIKVAIAIGTGVDNRVLCKFVGENAAKEAVITVHDRETLKNVIRLVSCSVSRPGSSLTSTDNKSKEEILVEDIKSGLDEMTNTTLNDVVDNVIDIKPLGDADLFNE